MTLIKIQSNLKRLANQKTAQILKRFFKTGPGEYGEGDQFIGVRVPELRKIAKTFESLPLTATWQLLKSKTHEERMLALLILMRQFKKGDEISQERIYKFYMQHTKHINNWDLVDVSAPHIPGGYLFSRNKKILYDFAKSKDLWKRRIAIISTFHFIRQNQFNDTLKIAKTLLKDEHDLIHKAVGWMLREIGKRDLKAEEEFLKAYYRKMPRTMLRYAIERFPEKKRKHYLEKQ